MNKSILLSLLFTSTNAPLLAMESHSKDLARQLQSAIYKNNIEMVELLLDGGVDPNSMVRPNTSALSYAINDGINRTICRSKICRLLIERGANVNVKDSNGWPLLSIACAHKHFNIVKLLVSNGADVNSKNENANTPLMVAILCKAPNICSYLLKTYVDLHAKDTRGRNVLALAASEVKRLPLCNILITQSLFNPHATRQELQESGKKIALALWAFKYAQPSLPKDIQIHIFASDPELWRDICNSPCNLHARHSALHMLPSQVLHSLIQGKIINPEKAVHAIKNNNFNRLQPMMVEAREWAEKDDEIKHVYNHAPNATPFIQTGKVHAFLDPELLEQNFGPAIEQNIRERLGLDSNKIAMVVKKEDE